jgi:hypothetical protein
VRTLERRLSEDPNREKSETETWSPTPTKCRARPKMESVDPSRATERTEMADPAEAAATSDNAADARSVPCTENASPVLLTARRESEEPKEQKFTVLTVALSRVALRTDSEDDTESQSTTEKAWRL